MPVDVEARVLANTRLSSDYNVIALAAPDIATASAPGQFVMVKLSRGSVTLLRRPFSVFEVLRTDGRIDGLTLLSKRVGATTDMLFDAVEGDVVSCLGPLGRPFELVDPPGEAWMVAGGVGLAPVLLFGHHLCGPVALGWLSGTGEHMWVALQNWAVERAEVRKIKTDF